MKASISKNWWPELKYQNISDRVLIRWITIVYLIHIFSAKYLFDLVCTPHSCQSSLC